MIMSQLIYLLVELISACTIFSTFAYSSICQKTFYFSIKKHIWTLICFTGINDFFVTMEKDREVAFQKVIRATGEVHMQFNMICILITANILKAPRLLSNIISKTYSSCYS